MCNGRQRVLLRQLNAHLALLSAEVEDIVSHQLDIVLTPVAIKLRPPTAEEFHETLAHLFAQGVSLSISSTSPREVVLRCEIALFVHIHASCASSTLRGGCRKTGFCERRHRVPHGGEAEAADGDDDHLAAAARLVWPVSVLRSEPCPAVRAASIMCCGVARPRLDAFECLTSLCRPFAGL